MLKSSGPRFCIVEKKHEYFFDAIEPGKGMAWLFACYGLLCVASLAFVAGWVPETKGKSLEEIERELVARPQASGEKGAA